MRLSPRKTKSNKKTRQRDVMHAHYFDEWKAAIASGSTPEIKLAIFDSAVEDIVHKIGLNGLDKQTAVDELYQIAEANNLTIDYTPEAITNTIGKAFEQADKTREAKAPPELDLLDVTQWEGIEPPERKWVVRDRIPAHNVTLLTGEGGVGKTLIMQQLAVATVVARDWIGSMPEPGPVLFITAEDDEPELHFRFSRIVNHYGVRFADLGNLHLLSLAGKDAVMAGVDARGIVRPTGLFQKLCNSATKIQPKWICIDTAADVFVVDERNRSEVRQCISLLRGLALGVDAAVVLLAHPSLSGIASGSGLSGSTAWNNSVRSRLYLKSPRKTKRDDDDAEDDDDGVRILETMKSNYGPAGDQIRLVWKDGLLVLQPGQTVMEKVAAEADARTIFLALLARYNKQEITVSAADTARNFAPNVFAKTAEAMPLSTSERQRKKLLRLAMDGLFKADKIYTAPGPLSAAPSRRSPCLFTGGSLI